MNEILFFLHTFIVLGFVWGAARLGREALIASVALQAVLANFFVLKQVELFGFHVTCADVFAIGSIAALNFLQEAHGKEAAKKGVWISFFAMGFFACMSQIHLMYLPSSADAFHPAYQALLGVAPRLMIASLTSFFVTQRVDVALFHWLKKRFSRAPLMVRSGISLFITQLLDTLLFAYLGLYGLGFSLKEVVFVSFILKLLIIACAIPLNPLMRKRGVSQ